MLLYALAMAGAKKSKKGSRSGGKGRPRTVRLSVDDEAWVDEQTHPQGFSGVLGDAVRFYREAKDERHRELLRAVV